MAVVAGVLLDHVEHDPAQVRRLAPPGAGHVEGGRRGLEGAGVLALRPPRRQVCRPVGVVDELEVTVRVLVVVVVERRGVLAGAHAPAPLPLDEERAAAALPTFIVQDADTAKDILANQDGDWNPPNMAESFKKLWGV